MRLALGQSQCGDTDLSGHLPRVKGLPGEAAVSHWVVALASTGMVISDVESAKSAVNRYTEPSA